MKGLIKGGFLYWAMMVAALSGCSERPVNAIMIDKLPVIYPDYTDVTIPAGIAPLNFNLMAEGQLRKEADAECVDVTVKGSKGGEIRANGKYANFDIEEWHELTRQNIGGQLQVTVCAKVDGGWFQYKDFTINVSEWPLDDYGLTYRKLAPGYEVYSHIGNFQRNIHNWEEEAIIESQSVPGQCMCCHTANRTNPKQFTFQLRGKHGSTLVQREVEEGDPAANGTANGKPVAREWLRTDTDSTLSKCVYPYWHPSGNYCAYSLNKIHQMFWTGKGRLIEVFDSASDVIVMDVRTHEIIRSPLIESTLDRFETYPAFSEDGRWLYFCSSRAHKVPVHADSLRYDLCRIAFDAETGTYGDTVETIIPATELEKSVTFPRPSYDGRWLMYCWSDFGNFPIDHKEADLWLLNLETSERMPAANANSDCTESYHNWSSDSRWFVFASRREDGLYSLLYLASIDDEGNISKPFLLPQENPWQFYHSSVFSYNVPDFTCDKVEFDVNGAYDEVFCDKKQQATVR